jgi:predicted transcriptional regulator YheO
MRARSTTAERHPLAAHFPVAAAVAALLHPHAEVVIHDISADRVVRIWNAFSKRRPGSPSHLGHDPDLLADAETYGPYEKANADGSRVKSISAILHDAKGRRAGFLCINLDMSKFDDAIALLQAFATPLADRPERLFRHDVREQINLGIRTFLAETGKSLGALDRADRIALLATLDRQGLFQTRNATPLVAQAMGLSRATIYGLLNEARRLPTSLPTARAKRAKP